MNKQSPIIFGIEGKQLTEAEIKFFKSVNPFGYIIFARNIESKSQLLNLTNSIRNLNGDENIPISIDQEGGRVARLRPPLVRAYPPAKHFGDMARKDMKAAYEATFDNYSQIGMDLRECGINVNCAPVADLLVESAHDIIGDRSFGSSVEIAANLCKAAALGLIAAGIQPIIKHIPGHGRALCDSHEDLPIVSADLKTLEQTDFEVFRRLSHLSVWAMTAHIIFTEIDKDHCITTSKEGMDYIRHTLGYNSNLIMSDDLSMKALKNTPGQNAVAALNAGCDIALHCNGKMEEMVDIYESYLSIRKAA